MFTKKLSSHKGNYRKYCILLFCIEYPYSHTYNVYSAHFFMNDFDPTIKHTSKNEKKREANRFLNIIFIFPN